MRIRQGLWYTKFKQRIVLVSGNHELWDKSQFYLLLNCVALQKCFYLSLGHDITFWEGDLNTCFSWLSQHTVTAQLIRFTSFRHQFKCHLTQGLLWPPYPKQPFLQHSQFPNCFISHRGTTHYSLFIINLPIAYYQSPSTRIYILGENGLCQPGCCSFPGTCSSAWHTEIISICSML